jgi:dihydrofolate reductase
LSNIVYIATSLDGYIAKKDGNLDWLTKVPNPDDSDFGFSEFIKRIDCIIMGRKTFEVIVGFDDWIYTKPVFVLSNILKEIPTGYENKVEILNGELKNILKLLNERNFNNMYIDGGKTIQSFLKENLIDEIIITRIPVILGNGISLFAEMDLEINFEHIETEIYNNSLVKSRYIKKL